MIKFLRTEERAGNPIAVFDRGYEVYDPYDGRDDGTFCLDEESLRSRIDNIKTGLNGPSRDASVEHEALRPCWQRRRLRNESSNLR
jgi:hypothetical protein